MGVPKFFRFYGERYPLLTNLIVENQIPEFDNLYLDMNGIVHNCSHPNDEDVHFRLSEEQVFLGIFSYIEHLFSKIKPRKTFFMAIDGVAPRAKMNQQRSRRFRTAKEAKEAREKAERKGEALPKEAAFDSNAITPGTPFMARLSAQLKWWVNKKVSEDADWRGVQVILSGHEVPGEGEHKIMEYIRLAKAQPDYNPNLRHCLYGLDADLIMLGLLSHDPHFCLLREEVTFGPRNRKGASKPGPGKLDGANFYLLHLSLWREYLDLEFQDLAHRTDLGFEYDLERVIDDFILLCMLIGNDFLPHLPGLHINEGAMSLLFGIYKRILPVAGGYINEHGHLNLQRLQLVLNELTSLEREQFETEFADSNWFKGKQKRHIDAMESARKRNKLVLTSDQRKLYEQVRQFLDDTLATPDPTAALTIPATLPARDRRFLQELADGLHLSIAFDEFDAADEPIIVLRFDEHLLGLAAQDDEEDVEDGTDEDGEWVDDDDEGDEEPAAGTNGHAVAAPAEWRQAIDRELAKYAKAPVKDVTADDFEDEYERKLEAKMAEWRADYYRDKLEIHDPKDVRALAFRYIEGLQWVLHYYYDGVASWSWFYDYHYAPKISDLRNITEFDFDFQLGSPFKPFEQLMGVLPDLSAALIPEAYRDLMSDPESPIIHFYPRTFETDLNGKKADWEAIVKIPFIDEKRLLGAMKNRENRLTADERARNSFGDSWTFVYDETADLEVASSLPGFFPDLHHCKSVMTAFELPTLSGLKLVKGLCEGVLLGKDAVAGFPSLSTLPCTGALGFQAVSVFQQESRNESMVLTVDNVHEGVKTGDLAASLIGTTAYYGWPFLQEGRVVAVSDGLFRYEPQASARGAIVSSPHAPQAAATWHRTAERIENHYSKRCGVIIGTVDTLVHIRLVKGLKQLDDGALVKDYDDRDVDCAVQTLVTHVSNQDERYLERNARPIFEDFPPDSKVFMLGSTAYGAPAIVIGHHDDQTLAVKAMLIDSDKQDVYSFKSIGMTPSHQSYVPSHVVTRRVRMSALTLAKLSSSLMMDTGHGQRFNAGLNIKFDSKSQKVLGYTRKTDNGWEYSDKAIELIASYKAAFPEIISSLDSKAKSKDLMDIADFFPSLGRDEIELSAKAAELKAWIAQAGVRDFEKVPLFSDQLETAVVQAIEQHANQIVARTQATAHLARQIAFTKVPRRALLKPEQAAQRLQAQTFALGDRVVMVDEAGNVPLAAKGVVVGIAVGALDVIFDFPFMAGTTLGGRCSVYRGASVAPASLLNLALPQLLHHIRDPRGAAGGPPAGPAMRGGGGGGRGGRGGAGIPRGGPVRPHVAAAPAHPNGNIFVGNYVGAASGTSPAYITRPAPSHAQQMRQQVLNTHAVPPPMNLLNEPSRRGGRGRGGGAVGRGGAAPSAVRIMPQGSLTLPTEPVANGHSTDDAAAPATATAKPKKPKRAKKPKAAAAAPAPAA